VLASFTIASVFCTVMSPSTGISSNAIPGQVSQGDAFEGRRIGSVVVVGVGYADPRFQGRSGGFAR